MRIPGRRVVGARCENPDAHGKSHSFVRSLQRCLVATLTAPEVAAAAARRVLDGLRTPFTLRGNQVPVTASLGVALGAESDLDDLLREADIAMYMAKAHGKARFELAAGEVLAVSRPRV